jgi:hypothetical protein
MSPIAAFQVLGIYIQLRIFVWVLLKEVTSTLTYSLTVMAAAISFGRATITDWASLPHTFGLFKSVSTRSMFL